MSKKKKAAKKPTPLMQQYFKMKSKYPDALLLYRVGDFYETFGDDAEKAANILGITLTSRNNGGSNIALAGFPHHSLDLYLPRLVKAGLRVAICEQLEKPNKNTKLVKRGVTEMITPGLALNDQLLDHKSNNFLASVHFEGDSMGVAFLDLSTGEFLVSEGSSAQVEKLLQSLQAREIIYASTRKEEMHVLTGTDFHIYPLEEWIFTLDFARPKLLDQFQVQNLKGFGIEELKSAQIAAGAILQYLMRTENTQSAHINSIRRLQSEEYVWLDKFTIRNLELIQSPHATGIPLYEILDDTISPMGARQMKKWVVLPINDLDDIKGRHDIVEHYLSEESARADLREELESIGDLERLISKVPSKKINPRETAQLKVALDRVPDIREKLESAKVAGLKPMIHALNDCPTVRAKIGTALMESPPPQIGKEKVIADEFHPELDEYRSIIKDSKKMLLDLQVKEAEETGIQNLKVGFNNVFGYYLEVTNKYKNKGMVPDHWIRKQTLTNSERYISEELKILEEKILTAEEKSLELEAALYDELVSYLEAYIEPIQLNARTLGKLDCLLAFSQIAEMNDYVRPVMDDEFIIDLKQARHPVIEKSLPTGEPFIPNDIYLDDKEQQIMMITGPNMSGKSAILRQTALIVLMAQMGCFVPATSARIGRIDKVFSRVGASDNISSGESTFMVEMNETSSILNNVSPRSLILLDEIGRGTSTYDGISIAWAIAEFLHESTGGAPKTLFATHYHELNQLADKYERVKNYNVATKESRNQIVFLRKLQAGGSHHSFGIQVARMAGMPDLVIDRARQILSRLESKNIQQKEETQQKLAQMEPSTGVQLSMFGGVDPQWEAFRDELKNLDLSTMTPIECMMKLKSIQENLDENNKAPSKNR